MINRQVGRGSRGARRPTSNEPSTARLPPPEIHGAPPPPGWASVSPRRHPAGVESGVERGSTACISDTMAEIHTNTGVYWQPR